MGLQQVIGTPVTAHLVKRAYEGVALQYGKELLAELGIGRARCGQPGSLHQVSVGHVR